MTEGPDQARAPRYPAVLTALQEATAHTRLRVRPEPDLYGASVIGPVVEAYVLAVRDGGIQVDLWRHDGDDPYRTVTSPDLDEAVRLAVNEASARHEQNETEPDARDGHADVTTKGVEPCKR